MPLLRVRYQTIEFGDTDIHVKTLRDCQEYSDPDNIAHGIGISSANWSLFGVIWASGEILARQMYEYDINGKRILEVGCGIALASLVLNSRSADITATDYHPDAERFLNQNTQLNNDKPIPFTRTSWSDHITALGKFDIIIGGDLLYERGHADDLSQFIDQHANTHCKVMIVDPGRKQHAKFSKKMIGLGYEFYSEAFLNLNELSQPTNGYKNFRTLHYQR
ncbi:MAG: histidine kinase [Gammaproteobacteria bacterium]|nr:histidine kinase [Gammaproteobacteria bacterium]MDH5730802.1 histidine kinase [Gammaproteobacteria bacterium]